MIERGELVEGTYRMVLRAELEQLDRLREGWGVQSRYVYVFVIDQEGRSTQLFPNAGSQEREHFLPQPQDLKGPSAALTELSLGESGAITIDSPYGTDTYLLITSAQSIPHLAELVESGPVTSQSFTMRGGADWSIDRIFLRSVPAVSQGASRN